MASQVSHGEAVRQYRASIYRKFTIPANAFLVADSAANGAA
jgi:hypothetical protein